MLWAKDSLLPLRVGSKNVVTPEGLGTSAGLGTSVRWEHQQGWGHQQVWGHQGWGHQQDGDTSRGSVAICGLSQAQEVLWDVGLVTFSISTLDSVWDTCWEWGEELMLPLPTPALAASRKRNL